MQEYKTLEILAKEQQKNYQDDIILAMVDGKLRELSKEADPDSEISFVTVADCRHYDKYIIPKLPVGCGELSFI